MDQYLGLVEDVLAGGAYKPNRTGVDTISSFSHSYSVDLDRGFPLLTTKRMDTFRWESLIHELLWYFSGEEHIRTLREHTGIWDEWADEEGHLDTAYGRFWRRYPVPTGVDRLPGESWADVDGDWVTEEPVGAGGRQSGSAESGETRLVFDQLQYVLDTLKENPQSRRMVVSAWHPANAAVSTLPPCHYTFVFSVQGDQLNLHLTQRSGDIALGIPFNLAAYSLICTIVANRAGLEPGTFSHTIVDAHVYCGAGERGRWYQQNLARVQERLGEEQPTTVRDWISTEAPSEPEGYANHDHVPGLLTQLEREPYERPHIQVPDKPLDELAAEDVQLREYESHPGIDFGVAE